MSDRLVALIVVAAGSSRRMQGLDKVWASLDGRPVLWHSLSRLGRLADRTVLVVRPEDIERAEEECRSVVPELLVVAGGPERQDSVRHGLDAAGDADVMAVHDAARPLAAGWLLQAGIDAVRDSPGAVPALPLHDTLKRVDAAGKVVETVDRATLRAVQTPQVFVASALRQAHEQAARSGTTMTDDAGLLERAGLAVSVFPGSPANLKITTARDLELAHLLLRAGLAS